MTTTYPRIPDLLRRFTPTPLSICFRIGAVRVRLETNDPEIIAALARFEPSAATDGCEPAFHWKLVREDECGTSGKGISVLASEELITLFRGDATVIAVDRVRREVLGFVSPDVSPTELSASLFPLLAEWAQLGISSGDVTSSINE